MQKHGILNSKIAKVLADLGHTDRIMIADCGLLGDIPGAYVTHERLKEYSHDVKAIIRTGEATPYANVILQSGCIF